MVFTQGLGASPFCAALRAIRPAASIMAGSVAVVQLVTAAMASAPWVSSCSAPPTLTFTVSSPKPRSAHT